MAELSSGASIAVRIGERGRVYRAFVTTAPMALDAPSTFTLYTATLAELSLLAADTIVLDATRGKAHGRLVLIDTTEFAWQRARSRELRHLLVPADPGLVGPDTLQLWLWRRLRSQ